jgi:diphthamide biosynthesis protein 2
MAAFSTTDEAILTAPLELDPLAQSATASSSGRSIYHVYDIVSTAAKIHSGRFQRVALQFPDEALVDSVPVYWALRHQVRSLIRNASSSSSSSADSASSSPSPVPDFFILADTSYGGCCVDEVAAKHVDADLVVHFGHACLSATARLPVIYVFTKQPLASVSDAAQALAAHAKNNILQQSSSGSHPSALVFTYDVSWHHVAQDVFEATQLALKQHGISLPFVRTHVDLRTNYEDKLLNGTSRAAVQQTSMRAESCACTTSQASPASTCCGAASASCCAPSSTCASATATSSSANAPYSPPTHASDDVRSDRDSHPLGAARSVTLPQGIDHTQCGYLYLGPESLSLTNLLLTLGPSTPLVSYDPIRATARVETGSTNRLLMKRYASVLKARDASVVGLLVGTLGVHSYLPLLQHLRALLTSKKSARKVYTISVGKLNPAKLANFQEIDVFVLVACPENTLVDSKEFFRPIVTPFEMQLAVNAAERQQRGEEGVDWSGKYVLDLDKLVPPHLRDAQDHQDLLARMDQVELDDTHASAQIEDERHGQDDEDDDDDDDDDRPHFSLVSGTYVHRRKFHGNARTAGSLGGATDSADKAVQLASAQGGTQENSVVMRNAATGEVTTVLESASLQHVGKRAWQGLEQRIGLDEPSMLEEGRQGIAKGYKDAGGHGHTM